MARPTKNQKWRDAISKAVTKLTPEVVQKLKDAFAVGATVEQACCYAEIAKQTYYNWIEKNPVLLDEFEKMRQKLPLQAKNNIAQRIYGKEVKGDISLSQWLISRTESSQYGDRLKVEHSGELKTDATQPHPEDESLRLEYKQKLVSNIQRRAREKDKPPAPPTSVTPQ